MTWTTDFNELCSNFKIPLCYSTKSIKLKIEILGKKIKRPSRQKFEKFEEPTLSASANFETPAPFVLNTPVEGCGKIKKEHYYRLDNLK